MSFWRRFELCWLVLDKDGQAGRVCTRNTTSNLSGKHETQSDDKESAWQAVTGAQRAAGCRGSRKGRSSAWRSRRSTWAHSNRVQALHGAQRAGENRRSVHTAF